MSKLCFVCNHTLIGRQRKFCSQKCKNKYTNNKHQNYIAQQYRGQSRRIELIKAKGGKCEICGYNKNPAVLCFHHIHESTKIFQLTIRECSNNSMDKLLDEAKKCQLLCHNCHIELHYPHFNGILNT